MIYRPRMRPKFKLFAGGGVVLALRWHVEIKAVEVGCAKRDLDIAMHILQESFYFETEVMAIEAKHEQRYWLRAYLATPEEWGRGLNLLHKTYVLDRVRSFKRTTR